MKFMKKSTMPQKVRLSELFEILSFYAEKENYINYYNWRNSSIGSDCGRKARKILKRLVNEYLEEING